MGRGGRREGVGGGGRGKEVGGGGRGREAGKMEEGGEEMGDGGEQHIPTSKSME